MMTAEDVLEVMRCLNGAGIQAWLHGGWGVDALLDQQTRKHKDLDLVVELSDVPHMQALLAERGYRLVQGGPPKNFVLEDETGRQVDVHPVAWDEHGNGIYRMENGHDWTFPSAGFAGNGSVLGRRVRCFTAEAQMLCYIGYELSDKDCREMDALHQRFGVEYPPEYQKHRTED
jgi:lincosamide nucleotidyltransferase A/C/D/E